MTKKTMATRVEPFVKELERRSGEQAKIIEQVRKLYKDIHPDISEKIIYGGVGFFLKDEPIGDVYPYKEHVSIVFSRGNELSDPDGLLNGKGKFRRHLKAFSRGDVDPERLSFFIKQLSALT